MSIFGTSLPEAKPWEKRAQAAPAKEYLYHVRVWTMNDTDSMTYEANQPINVVDDLASPWVTFTVPGGESARFLRAHIVCIEEEREEV